MDLTSIGGNHSKVESFEVFKVRLDMLQVIFSMQNMADLLFSGICSIVLAIISNLSVFAVDLTLIGGNLP